MTVAADAGLVCSIDGQLVRRIGLGSMGMSFAYQDDPNSDTPAEVFAAAFASGSAEARVLIDTADVYGPATNEELVGAALARHGTDGVFVATKGGLVAPGGDTFEARPCGRPDHLRSAVDASLRRLSVDRIDLYQLHRVDPAVPLSESWSALAELVTVGKIASLGICTLDRAQLDLAHAIHPVAAVQAELSLLATAPLTDVVPWCEQHSATFLAYGPLTRGLLAGSVTPTSTFGDRDIRSRLPLFATDGVKARWALVDAIRQLAKHAGLTPAQLVLRRLLAHSPTIMAIPGTRRAARWRENTAAGQASLASDLAADLDRLIDVTPPVPVLD